MPATVKLQSVVVADRAGAGRGQRGQQPVAVGRSGRTRSAGPAPAPGPAPAAGSRVSPRRSASACDTPAAATSALVCATKCATPARIIRCTSAPLGSVGRHPVHAGEQQRVVGQQQLRPGRRPPRRPWPARSRRPAAPGHRPAGSPQVSPTASQDSAAVQVQGPSARQVRHSGTLLPDGPRGGYGTVCRSRRSREHSRLDGAFGYCAAGCSASSTYHHRRAQCRNLPKLVWLFIVLLLADIGSIAWLVPAATGWRPSNLPTGIRARPVPGTTAGTVAAATAETTGTAQPVGRAAAATPAASGCRRTRRGPHGLRRAAERPIAEPRPPLARAATG